MNDCLIDSGSFAHDQSKAVVDIDTYALDRALVSKMQYNLYSETTQGK